ncbi:MAG: hypothetical protein JWR09_2543 [Mucilaginibacter sp.]|nr:hypothetical protein [Mucilaginibacter sp.]
MVYSYSTYINHIDNQLIIKYLFFCETFLIAFRNTGTIDVLIFSM